MAKQGLGLEITELRLGLPGSCSKKRAFSSIMVANESCEDQNKNRVVGWPPVRSLYRKKNNVDHHVENECEDLTFYVKVGMDGRPFLRKIDLKTHQGYLALVVAFEKLFGIVCNEGVLKDSEGCEYVLTYEDRDGDWLLVGDVPWEMFAKSCRRLRITKRLNIPNEFQLQSRICEHNNHGQGQVAEAR